MSHARLSSESHFSRSRTNGITYCQFPLSILLHGFFKNRPLRGNFSPKPPRCLHIFPAGLLWFSAEIGQMESGEPDFWYGVLWAGRRRMDLNLAEATGVHFGKNRRGTGRVGGAKKPRTWKDDPRFRSRKVHRGKSGRPGSVAPGGRVPSTFFGKSALCLVNFAARAPL